ncbi:glycoside hydrolase family 10 protein, partial [Chitinimonas sp.]|uniref:glycoside hydrolase family 10 protein n=1 Tax=Chitinimonas sp. TaxID=1934313 RepID=UPI002F924B89
MATVLAAIWLAGCATVPAPSQPGNELPDSSEPVRRIPSPATPQTPDESVLQAPPAPREFRAAWVTTIGNIDWPSRPGLSSAQQQVELRAILDRAVAMKLNAVILQVRPAADALYASELEPWSEYLTGVQGKAPEPYYDPLTLWVEEAHKRGLELHAWFNPFRAHYDQARSRVDSQHITKIAPELIKRYGEFRWMDPGEPEAVRHTVAVIADVVRRYDIDGVQIDDYFYPYPVNGANGKELPFPDESSWRRYQLDGGTLEKADWRRQNVNQLVEQLYERIHAEKHWVKFGISPFGLGRPDRRAPGIVGFSQYDKLYADVERWLRAGWVDYLAPQLYWPSKQSSQAFGTLLDGWLAENALRRHIWPGLFTSGLAGPARPWPADEILQQIAQVRQRAGAGGHIHFGLGMLMQDKQGIRSRLTAGPYAETALVPASPWLDATPPPA